MRTTPEPSAGTAPRHGRRANGDSTGEARSGRPDYAPPPVDGDFYRIAAVLNESERALLKRVRDFTEGVVAPMIEDYWARDAFPFEIIPKMAELGIGGVGYQGYGAAGGSWLLNGFVAMELARVDCVDRDVLGRAYRACRPARSICAATRQQKQRWLPAMMRFEKIGSFGLTEPLVGSATSGGMMTTCRREGDTWVLNGQKKWIGNATFADINVIWAREEARTRSRASWSERTIRASRSRRSRPRWRCAWCRTG